MIGALLMLAVYLAILVIVVGLLLWLIDAIPVPQPINKFARIATIVIAVIVIVLLLLQMVGVGGSLPAPR